MRAVVFVTLVFAVLAGACWSTSPTPPSGTIKCSSDPSRPCPRSYVCVNGFCDLVQTTGDGGSGIDGGVDGG